MLTKFFKTTILIILTAVFQLSFVKSLPLPFNNLNLILIILVFITLANFHQALWLAFVLGLILDIYSPFGFGLISLSLILAVMAVNFLANNLLTNRSPFSLLTLGMAATIFFQLAIFIFNHLYFYLKLISWPQNFSNSLFQNLLWQLILNLGFLLFISYFFKYLIFYVFKSFPNLRKIAKIQCFFKASKRFFKRRNISADFKRQGIFWDNFN